ncbi:hypothetical protein K443DRAFT_682694 [Laccaria amethystina LaAM-08-1]|uniref:Uncharacterized protein n=1 Tax=Laccaria amethystina LaAM-08-1 TaxID=1095629 RepID=A0A0C9XI82_9AGAR|nr:hypothetical protein K443DRAFT_682694 [Laccaria amethystina LaAM-08-1]
MRAASQDFPSPRLLVVFLVFHDAVRLERCSTKRLEPCIYASHSSHSRLPISPLSCMSAHYNQLLILNTAYPPHRPLYSAA